MNLYSFKRSMIALVTASTVICAGMSAVEAAPSTSSITAEDFNKDVGSIDSNSSNPETNTGSSATYWFDRQQGWVQTLIIVISSLQIAALLIGPARALFYNLFKV
ncbi:hypothetical protein N7326_00335 [Corynebacterium sp. ES2794-CONJ1]|uniref:hypothetical protein n=1 Tax=unclassified Corynebacterium TaxID=2624378 RepID=UPI002167F5D8|nr:MULTISPECIES: hypothetical protein [unclassified Corynebacterium]MCS4489353.1 hypothetical protein [Corynebacterium sp. ES2775-CONJ]MCS4491166.1 hypothetical protein [Corynebacterium sp. ES2715-CONJ3]MCS4530953.1 hypothetical protein [Corynebacterium sp. ES2730-CONJ]MCU9518320.1 hypothetical protein [Corynebacterium sp. ES2794-CONJ1]